MGCTLAARRAGIQLAHNATIISSVAAPHSVTGSDGVMPNSIDFTHRVTANDAPMPIAIAAADWSKGGLLRNQALNGEG